MTQTPNSKSIRQLYAQMGEELLADRQGVTIQSWPIFQRLIGGFRPKEFSILCGATGTGKTTLLANWSSDLLVNKKNHFVMSVETGPIDYLTRVASALLKKDINHGEVVPLDILERLHTHHGQYFNSDHMWLSLYENRVTVEQLLADLKYHLEEKKCEVAFIDNLNFFMEITRASDSIVEMDRVIHELILFCKQYPMHIVMVMHPRKTVNGRVQSEFDIKGSSTSVQEAHNVFLFNRAHPTSIKDKLANEESRELKIAKMRRRGKHTGKTLILDHLDSVFYYERDVCFVVEDEK